MWIGKGRSLKLEAKGKKGCSASEWEEMEVKREGSQSAFPTQRDPLLWKAGVGIATVRGSVASGTHSAFQACTTS